MRRRLSVFLALAAILLIGAVAITYRISLAKRQKIPVIPTPEIENQLDALANGSWSWHKDDPKTNRPNVQLLAKSFQAIHAPSVFKLKDVGLRIYNYNASHYTYVKSAEAIFNEAGENLKSDGAVTIIMNVPAGKDAADPKQVEKLVRVETSGVTYATKTGRAETDKPARFKFSDGGGTGVGVSYDPNLRSLHIKSNVALDMVGDGPLDNAMHVEAGDLVYKELEQKIYLSPWSKLRRQSTTIQAKNSLVTLIDGVLHQVDSDHAIGSDNRDGRKVDYAANKMTALFDEDGVMVNIVGEGQARIISGNPAGRTTVTSDRADLRFAVNNDETGETQNNDSLLHLVLADGHANAESVPLPQPGVQLAETRVLKSEHIELEMQPDGENIKEIRTPTAGQLEFKPNRPDQLHRTLDAHHLRILYGEDNNIDTFLAWQAATRTDKPPIPAKDGQPGKPAPPSLTWSDQLVAKFAPGSNDLANIEQTGHFRYQEGVRHAQASKAVLQQNVNLITLTENAKILDDTGSTIAQTIVMNQANGDMDARGRVSSTHEPDRNAKPGTSMLDDTQPLQARADEMQSRENNLQIFYEGHAVVWQGADRITAKYIVIDRDSQTLHAQDNVVSQLVDQKAKSGETDAAPIFTVVHAPEMVYDDDSRLAHYTGGARLLRNGMTINSSELRAFLSPKNGENSNNSSLDHAFADGNVVIVRAAVNKTGARTGTSQHAEYYPQQNKVILNGGLAQMVENGRGVTRGRQLTYFSDDDRMVVEGEKGQLAFTRLNKR